MPLNAIHGDILESAVYLYIEEIVEDETLSPQGKLILLQAMKNSFDEKIFLSEYPTLKEWVENIKAVRAVLDHPNPQNRREDYPYLRERDKARLAEGTQVIYLVPRDKVETESRKAGERHHFHQKESGDCLFVEPVGLLSLSAEDDIKNVATADDVKGAILAKIDGAIVGLRPSPEQRADRFAGAFDNFQSVVQASRASAAAAFEGDMHREFRSSSIRFPQFQQQLSLERIIRDRKKTGEIILFQAQLGDSGFIEAICRDEDPRILAGIFNTSLVVHLFQNAAAREMMLTELAKNKKLGDVFRLIQDPVSKHQFGQDCIVLAKTNPLFAHFTFLYFTQLPRIETRQIIEMLRDKRKHMDRSGIPPLTFSTLVDIATCETDDRHAQQALAQLLVSTRLFRWMNDGQKSALILHYAKIPEKLNELMVFQIDEKARVSVVKANLVQSAVDNSEVAYYLSQNNEFMGTLDSKAARAIQKSANRYSAQTAAPTDAFSFPAPAAYGGLFPSAAAGAQPAGQLPFGLGELIDDTEFVNRAYNNRDKLNNLPNNQKTAIASRLYNAIVQGTNACDVATAARKVFFSANLVSFLVVELPEGKMPNILLAIFQNQDFVNYFNDPISLPLNRECNFAYLIDCYRLGETFKELAGKNGSLKGLYEKYYTILPAELKIQVANQLEQIDSGPSRSFRS